MSNIGHNGGPAFPQHSITLSDDGVTLHENVSGGMTLRDWFAGQAPEPPKWWWLSMECPTPPPEWNEGDGPAAWQDAEHKLRIAHMVAWRWTYADAMLAERNKGGAK